MEPEASIVAAHPLKFTIALVNFEPESLIMSTFADCNFHLAIGPSTDFALSDVRLAGDPSRIQSWYIPGCYGPYKGVTVLGIPYMKGADVVFVAFDFTDRDRFNSLEADWFVDLWRMKASMVIVLVATDGVGQGHMRVKPGPRVVSEAEGRAMAVRLGASYAEASTATGVGVVETFFLGIVLALQRKDGPRSFRVGSPYLHERTRHPTKEGKWLHSFEPDLRMWTPRTHFARMDTPMQAVFVAVEVLANRDGTGFNKLHPDLLNHVFSFLPMRDAAAYDTATYTERLREEVAQARALKSVLSEAQALCQTEQERHRAAGVEEREAVARERGMQAQLQPQLEALRAQIKALEEQLHPFQQETQVAGRLRQGTEEACVVATTDHHRVELELQENGRRQNCTTEALNDLQHSGIR
jgi:hypothetical protein